MFPSSASLANYDLLIVPIRWNVKIIPYPHVHLICASRILFVTINFVIHEQSNSGLNSADHPFCNFNIIAAIKKQINSPVPHSIIDSKKENFFSFRFLNENIKRTMPIMRLKTPAKAIIMKIRAITIIYRLQVGRDFFKSCIKKEGCPFGTALIFNKISFPYYLGSSRTASVTSLSMIS